jgi:hypothetical protein
MYARNDHPILRACANRDVPSWVHELALARSQDYSWAGRNDCPAPIAQALLEREVVKAPDADALAYRWYGVSRKFTLATVLIARDDLDGDALVEVADESLKPLVKGIFDRTLTWQELAGGTDDKATNRYAKYLVQLLDDTKPLSMTACEWVASRPWSCDAMVSKLAYNITRLGGNQRLLWAMRSVTGESPLARINLGYLCRHEGEHSVDETECLYHALGHFDAHAIIQGTPEWAVGWLGALTPEARLVALAMLENGVKGNDIRTVTEAAAVVTV